MDVNRAGSGATKAAIDGKERSGSGHAQGGERLGSIQQAHCGLACRDLGAWIFASVVVNSHQQAAFAALVAAESDGRLCIYDDAPPWQAWRVCERVQGAASGEEKARHLSLRLWASEWEEATYRVNLGARDAEVSREACTE